MGTHRHRRGERSRTSWEAFVGLRAHIKTRCVFGPPSLKSTSNQHKINALITGKGWRSDRY